VFAGSAAAAPPAPAQAADADALTAEEQEVLLRHGIGPERRRELEARYLTPVALDAAIERAPREQLTQAEDAEVAAALAAAGISPERRRELEARYGL
jgi:hypothetical protein